MIAIYALEVSVPEDHFTDFNRQHAIETFKSMISISIEIFKALILINGGAAAGIVATLDKLATLLPKQVIRESMTAFLMGLSLAVLATFFAYFTQNKLHEENMSRAKGVPHYWMQLAAILCCLGSLIGFVWGAMSAARGL